VHTHTLVEMKIIFLSKHPTLCPESIAGLFGPALDKIASTLKKALHSLAKNPDPSSQLSGKAQSKACVYTQPLPFFGCSDRRHLMVEHSLAGMLKEQITKAKGELQGKSLQEGFDTILASLE